MRRYVLAERKQLPRVLGVLNYEMSFRESIAEGIAVPGDAATAIQQRND